jgi:hypothetical protein
MDRAGRRAQQRGADSSSGSLREMGREAPEEEIGERVAAQGL